MQEVNNFDRLKAHLLDLRITTILVISVTNKISCLQTAWQGKEAPKAIINQIEDLTKLKFEFLSHSKKMGWKI